MNYNDSILENKTFSFFKKLIFNIALAVCIILFFVVILVYGFKFQLYNVLSDSEYPYFVTGDMIVAVPQKEYEVGDIIKFDHISEAFPVTHRLVGKIENGGKTYYICHGDAVATSNPFKSGEVLSWQEESEFIQSLNYAQITGQQPIIQNGVSNKIKSSQIQIVEKKAIDGKVICHFNNYGHYFTFIKEHKMLVITIVIAIWSVSSAIQNELDIKRMRRLES